MSKQGALAVNLLIILGVALLLSIILILYLLFFRVTPITISNSQISSGVSVDLKENQQAKFNLDNEQHSVTVGSVNGDTVHLIIQSNNLEIDLKLNEEKKFDLNGDGYYDLYVKVISIDNGIAKLDIKRINESISPSNENNQNSNNNAETQVCNEDWNCSSWSGCSDGKQTRTCNDLNICGTINDKPNVKKDCTSVNDSSSTSVNIDTEWNVFQEYVAALKNRDLTKINSLSYTPLPQNDYTNQIIDMAYSITSNLKKSDFVNLKKDSKQSILSTNEKDGTINLIYFVKDSSNNLIILGIQNRDFGVDSDGDGLRDSDENCIGLDGNPKPSSSGCIITDPNKKDTDDDGWWDGIEEQAGTNPNNASDYLFK